MPYSKIWKKCEICGEFAFIRKNNKVCSEECRRKIISQKVKKESIEKICKFCGEKYIADNSFKKKEQIFCSKKCSFLDKKGKSLLEMGFSREEYEKHVERTIIRNKSTAGMSFYQKFGEERTKEILKEMSNRFSGEKNPMSYKSLKDRNPDAENLKELTPCFGRSGNRHPMFGKSHTLEAKKKMIEKNSNMGNWNVYQGYFDDIFWQGTWELSYIIYCIENKINIKRYDIDPIEYLDGEKIRHFFPDFIIEENKIVEIKGKFKNEKLNLLKKQAASKIDNFIFLDDEKMFMNKGNKYLLEMLKKYGDRIKIKTISKINSKNSKMIIEYLGEKNDRS